MLLPSVVADPDLEVKARGGGKGALLLKIILGNEASRSFGPSGLAFWSKNRGLGSPGPSLDPPPHC